MLQQTESEIMAKIAFDQKDQTDCDQSRHSKRGPSSLYLLSALVSGSNHQGIEIRPASRTDAGDQRKGASRTSNPFAGDGLFVAVALI